jgi:ABC-type branched-subunit amino acid transport system substrate-binding protein
MDTRERPRLRGPAQEDAGPEPFAPGGTEPAFIDRPLPRELFERLRRGHRSRRRRSDDDIPLAPVLTIVGPAGSGKTAVLDALERRGERLPYARLDLGEQARLGGYAPDRWPALLDSLCDQLRRRRPRQAPRPLFPRHDLATKIDQLVLEQRSLPAREEILERVESLLQDDRLGWWRLRGFRLLARSPWPQLAERPTPVRRLVLGRALHLALRWYEARRSAIGAEKSDSGIGVAETIVEVRRNRDPDLASGQRSFDHLRVDAFLADLRAAGRGGWLDAPAPGRYIIFIDDAHLLPDHPGENLLRLLLNARSRSEPDPLLLVITTDQRLVRDNPAWDGPQATVGEATNLDDTREAVAQWRKRWSDDRTATPDAWYLPVWLRGFTDEETRAFLASRDYVQLEQSVLFEVLRHTTHGHPRALELLGRASAVDHRAPQPPREMLGMSTTDTGPARTIADLLLEGFTRGFSKEAREHLAVCCAALDVDRETLAAALGPTNAHMVDRLWREYARSACTQIDTAGTTKLRFDPLLRDLMALTDTGGADVHRRLVEHFEKRDRHGEGGASRHTLYHKLALGEIDPVVEQLQIWLREQDRDWLGHLRRITEAPMPRGRSTPPTPPTTEDLRAAITTLVWCMWRQRSATGTGWVGPDLLWETFDALLTVLASTEVKAVGVAEEAENVHGLYRIGTGEEVRPPPAPALRRPVIPARPPSPWPPRRLAKLAYPLVAVFCLAYVVLYVDLSARTCDAPPLWSLPQVLDARLGRSGLYVSEVDGECVGLSDGTFRFGAGQAVQEIQERIAASNRAVAQAHEHYWTAVVVTTLPGGPGIEPTTDPDRRAELAAGLSELQGVYLAMYPQPGPPRPLRILIANAGSRGAHADRIAEQIAATAKADPTIVAVLGIGQAHDDDGMLAAVRRLDEAGIPVLSSTSSYRGGGGEPFNRWFRVAPSNAEQARLAVRYARDELGADSAAVIQVADDDYSRDLAQRFGLAAERDGLPITEVPALRSTGSPADSELDAALSAACARGSDLIYLAGRAADMDRLLRRPAWENCEDAALMGAADTALLPALHPGGQFPATAAGRLAYTAFVPPPGDDDPVARFYQLYEDTFPASPPVSGSAHHAALARDAAAALLDVLAYLPTSRLRQTAADLRSDDTDAVTAQLRLLHDVRLGRAAGAPAVTGVTGPVDFGPHLGWHQTPSADSDDTLPGDPVNKPIYVLRVDGQRQIVQGATEVTNRFP